MPQTIYRSVEKTATNDLLSSLAAGIRSDDYALIKRQEDHGNPKIDLLIGTVIEVDKLADIPLNGQEIVAMVPFCQVRERGFTAIDDGKKILCLLAEEIFSLDADEVIDSLPQNLPDVEDLGFGLDDDEYAEVAQKVIETEIGRGEGANFVIRRDYRAHTKTDPRIAAQAWLRQLLTQEQGAYWTYAFVTDSIIAVGASPERHVSSLDGTVLMNPISGTYRHGPQQPTETELLAFLDDRKESEELVMVVDEELKMMSAACPEGGVMRGPYLKPMSKLTHTEYLLEGKSSLDPREILRLTMFAPTVTGSPMGNACKVIARHETSGRGYYSGVLARFIPTSDHAYDLDAPILIRTAFLDKDGNITITAGATLVRHSNPLSEAAETRAKASGVLAALGLLPKSTELAADTTSTSHSALAATSAPVKASLQERNRHLAPFWRESQSEPSEPEALSNGQLLSATVIDCDDDFTAMLAHQLRRLGITATVQSWKDTIEQPQTDLVVFGPGPGDPLNMDDVRVRSIRKMITQRLDQQLPTLAVCLSHQMLSSLAGLEIVELPQPRQGTPLEVEIITAEDTATAPAKDKDVVDQLGQSIPAASDLVRIGYYNTFTAVADNRSLTPRWGLRVHSEPDTGFVHSLIGPKVASVQGHLESVLSFDGYLTLRRLIEHVLSE